MLIAEYLTCSKCNKSYNGIFKVNLVGDITCVDCENKSIIEDYIISLDNSDLEQEMVVNYLEQDIKHLYPTIFNINEVSIDQFLTENGELDAYKLYFQGNNLDFCTLVRRKAYICLDYIDTNDTKEIDFCINIIKDYLNLRFEKLSKKDVDILLNKLNSETFNYMVSIIGEI